MLVSLMSIVLGLIAVITSSWALQSTNLFYDEFQLHGDVRIEDECLQNLQSVVRGLGLREQWAFQFLDASTKIPSALLTGNIVDYGGYDECLSTISDDNSFRGQHCLASIQVQLNYSEIQQLPLRLSYCVPNSCSPSSVQVLLQNFFQQRQLNTTVGVRPEDCHQQQTVSLSVTDITGILICSLILFLALTSTAYDVSTINTNVRNEYFVSFSLYTNFKKLVDTTPRSFDLQPLHGIRFLSICWVILGHRYFFASSIATENAVDILKAKDLASFQLVAGGVLAVDTFFFISGLLNAYHLLIGLEKTRSFPVIKYFLHRYLRTTPALGMMVLIYSSWYTLLGSGPLWDKMTKSDKDLCQTYWWPTLLYINNYYNPFSECAGQSWYLAVDMQLYWLSPLIILPIWRWPKIRGVFLCLLLAISTAVQFSVSYLEKIRMPFTVSTNTEEFKKVTEMVYVPTHMRATPYIMGIMLGCYLQQVKRMGRTPRFTRVVVVMLWLLSTALCLTVIFSNHPFFASEANYPYNRLASSFYIAFHRIGWCLGVGIILFVCLFGYGGIVNSLLSWRAFIPLSRLTYCLFLCHLAVIQYQIGVTRTTTYYQDVDFLHRYLGDLLSSIFVAVVLSLLSEAPIMVIMKLLQTKKKVKKDESFQSGHDNDCFVVESER